MAKIPHLPGLDFQDASPLEEAQFDEQLYAAHAEIDSMEDLEKQRGTPIPALFNQFYKFIQNPSTVSVGTYKRMVDTDDTIGSGVDFLSMCLMARQGRYTHPSAEVTQFVNEALDRIEGGWMNAGKEMLSACWAGVSVSEKVWANTPMGFIVRKLSTLPPETVLFETERTGELTSDGILQYQRNYNPWVYGRGLGYYAGTIAGGVGLTGDSARPDSFAKLGDAPFPLRVGNVYNYLTVRIPRRKVVHYAFDAQGKFGNPYGRSLLRRVYKYYVLKDACLQMLSIALDRKGTPLTVVFADPNAVMIDPSRATGGSPKDQRGKGIRADQAAEKAFKNLHNDSVIILPGKKDEIFGIETLSQSSNAGDFIQALDFYNKSIMRGLLLPSLIFTNGDGTGSYSLGQEHAKTFDKILDSCLAGFNEVCRQQLIYELIAYNFPKSAWEKDGLGNFGKRELTRDEVDKEMQMFETGINAGIIDQQELNDLNKMRESIGFEPRETIIEKPNPMGAMMGEDEEGIEIGNGKKPDPKEE